MSDNGFTTSFSVEGTTPKEAFDAIIDVPGWWSGQVDGSTDTLGGEFTYRVPGMHYSKFRITEFVPAKKVAWLVLDSYLSFTEDNEEWTGTTVIFEVFDEDGATRVRFTHAGLVPGHECYSVCSNAWGQYINGSLRDLVSTGPGRPGSFEGERALNTAG
ncbi:SRPBCC domain-containing protein [Hoyosella sp. YIM 151337]|uniref:SRPBCC family protein n=1 Tax=Hoyosella sp. YIM 151337 TaxID=2992742 RepID=UPI0022367441|nr:SRPBCC domain-containing protein [Hoyosella sp. YIM 151337]MCW4351816.1 SRPBCC domain-containing protein [Hoyosella sp. YIM 151337]